MPDTHIATGRRQRQAERGAAALIRDPYAEMRAIVAAAQAVHDRIAALTWSLPGACIEDARADAEALCGSVRAALDEAMQPDDPDVVALDAVHAGYDLRWGDTP